ncbi:hypothetical protein ACFOON_10850 [Novosphingobium piscinae]|uniref:Phage gp6-like head-tail connector protein n=1 Tax=Novosphingobium piscinae TaxID=1507448 RepID=A0A7X1KR82_9SPHN|nr:hypothetical protein [Novosphingobium piscinae]MBC2670511.1 hypothetical protein [Novosphingobium piscinae]
MKRTIVTPAPLAPAALGALRDWLGIASGASAEDAMLTGLLRAALDSCEAFTGVLPLQAGCEERFAPDPGWQALATAPVQAILAVQGQPPSGPRQDLPSAAYAVELGADGSGRVRILAPGGVALFVVRYTAGLAPDWASLPDGLRHGLLRLAAHLYRQRDGDGADPAQPPAAIAALWRPWRGLRLQ